MRASLLVIAAAVVAAVPGVVHGQLPANQTVTFKIHEAPTDPGTPVVFTIRLDLAAVDQDGSWVGWEIESARFHQPGTGRAWTQFLPFVSTGDGLWWVEHADPNAPDMSEFVSPPLMFGTALNDDVDGPDLHFDVAGGPPPGNGPYTTTAILDYSFSTTATTEEDPPPSGDDDPTDLPDPVNDPWTAQ